MKSRIHFGLSLAFAFALSGCSKYFLFRFEGTYAGDLGSIVKVRETQRVDPDSVSIGNGRFFALFRVLNGGMSQIAFTCKDGTELTMKIEYDSLAFLTNGVSRRQVVWDRKATFSVADVDIDCERKCTLCSDPAPGPSH